MGLIHGEAAGLRKVSCMVTGHIVILTARWIAFLDADASWSAMNFIIGSVNALIDFATVLRS